MHVTCLAAWKEKQSCALVMLSAVVRPEIRVCVEQWRSHNFVFPGMGHTFDRGQG